MTVSINGTNGLTFNDNSTQNTAATGFGFKNRIINGDMRIDQRNAGASVTPANTTVVYLTDRFFFVKDSTNSPTLQQVSDAPSGFKNSLKFTNSNNSVTPSYAQVVQRIEGFNVADLGFGSASASTVTISFWIKSSVTGAFSVALRNSASNRSYVSTYTVNAANTWEQKTVTIAGDTSGTWLTDNGVGIELIYRFGGTSGTSSVNQWTATGDAFASGAVNIMATANSTWQVTGVQLEKGSTATSFDYRPYGTELQLCQRYCEKLPTGGYGAVGVRTTDWYGYIGWQTEKRANATVTLSGTVNIVGSVGDINTQTPTGIDQISTKTARLYRTGSLFTSQAGTFYVSDSILVTAEL